MNRRLVLGIGNRVMMDDGIGVAAVENLRDRYPLPDVRYVAGETDVDFCLREIVEANHVIVIDAAYLGGEPGSVASWPLNDALDECAGTESVHELDLLYAMKRERVRKTGLLITVEVSRIEICPELSFEMTKRFDGICEEIRSLINTFFESADPC